MSLALCLKLEIPSMIGFFDISAWDPPVPVSSFGYVNYTCELLSPYVNIYWGGS